MSHQRSSLPQHLALFALGSLSAACGISAAESTDDLAQSLDELTFGSPSAEGGGGTTAWTNNNNVVPICWENSPGYSVEKANVQNAVNATWGRSSSLQFTWTPTCPTTGTTKYLKMSVNAYAPPTDPTHTGGGCGLGMDQTFKSPSQPNNCYLGMPVGANPGRVAYLGVHEVGHALGMIHEQDRGENADSQLCGQRTSGVINDRTSLTIYDPNSVMNYCQAAGNNSGAITYLDRLGISEVYNRPYVALSSAKNGSLYHRGRTTTGTTGGSWSNFGSVESMAGEIGTIVESDMRTTHFGRTHVAAVTSNGGLFYTARNPNGTWESFIDVKPLSGNPGTVTRVTLAEDSSFLGPLEVNKMHLGAVTSDGHVWHAVRGEDGTWTPIFDIESATGNAGTFTDVSFTVSGDRLAGQEQLHLCGVTSDGDLWHAIRFTNESWTPMWNIEDGTTGETGNFVDVDCVSIGDNLHLIGVTTTGQVYHAIRFPTSGAWTSLWNVNAHVGGLSGTIHKVAVSQQRGQLNVVLRNTAGTLFYGVRPTGDWNSFVTIPNTSGVGTVDSVALD